MEPRFGTATQPTASAASAMQTMINRGEAAGRPRVLAVRMPRRMLPWIVLFALSCLAAYALQLVAEPKTSIDSPAPVTPTTIVAALPPLDDPQKMYLTIRFRDRSTGKVTSTRCVTDRGKVVSDVLEVEAEKALDVISALCDSGYRELKRG
jgi:hypothetical protein